MDRESESSQECEEVESKVERAHLLAIRGKLAEALTTLEAAFADHPEDAEVGRLIGELERRLSVERAEQRARQAAYSAARRRIMRFVGIGCLIAAYVSFRTSAGTRYGPVVTVGPVVMGLHLIYWRLLGIAALVLIGCVVLLVSSYIDPDWGSFDRP